MLELDGFHRWICNFIGWKSKISEEIGEVEGWIKTIPLYHCMVSRCVFFCKSQCEYCVVSEAKVLRQQQHVIERRQRVQQVHGGGGGGRRRGGGGDPGPMVKPEILERMRKTPTEEELQKTISQIHQHGL